MTEEEILSYMQQFNVDRETAIQEGTEILVEYWDKLNDEMYETYQDIIRSTH